MIQKGWMITEPARKSAERQIGESSFSIQQPEQRERHQEVEKGGVRGFAMAADAVRVCMRLKLFLVINMSDHTYVVGREI